MEAGEAKGKRVFLSGPMTNVDDYNVAAFAVANARLKRAGASEIYDPSRQWLDSDEPIRPHCTYMLRCLGELTREDKPDVPYYDMLVSLPGWESSEGARTERLVAEQCGIATYDWGG